MTLNEISEIVSTVASVDHRDISFVTDAEWSTLNKSLGVDLPEDYHTFLIALKGKSFPSEVLVVNPDVDFYDSVGFTYRFEIENFNWDKGYVPFIAVGNGDFFCICVKKESFGAVYYYYHDLNEYKLEHQTFESWIRSIPEFFAE